MHWTGFVLGVLCVWRVTHLLHAEDGPADLVLRLRRALGRHGRAMDCFYCLSIWVAAPFAAWIGTDLQQRLLLWGALSGGACLLERVTERQAPSPPPLYTEDQETPP